MVIRHDAANGASRAKCDVVFISAMQRFLTHNISRLMSRAAIFAAFAFAALPAIAQSGADFLRGCIEWFEGVLRL